MHAKQEHEHSLTSMAHQIDAVHHLVLGFKSVLPHVATSIGHTGLPDVARKAAAGCCRTVTQMCFHREGFWSALLRLLIALFKSSLAHKVVGVAAI